MPPKTSRRQSAEEQRQALAEVAADPRSPEARARLLAALASKEPQFVCRAARLVKEHCLDEFADALAEAFNRFMDGPPKADPGCQARLAALEALDYGESMDPAPFLRAVRCVQKEPADSAGGLRARSLFALARIGPPDFDLLAARRIADPLPMVRQASLDALAHRGDRSNAGLALLKLALGDEDPLVTLAAMSALLALAPEAGLAELKAAVGREDDEHRDLAAVALGQCRREEALEVLLAALERCVLPREREPVLRGIGLHRSERALTTLLAIVSESGVDDARVAIEALGARRHEAGLAARVREAAGRNQRARLGAVIDAAFGP
jgi:HEAT repeat protein